MSENFNRQFVMLDFKLRDDKEFLKFIASSEFATYLILRRYVWRGLEPHYMGLNNFYVKEKQLVCSLQRDKIAKFSQVILILPDL